MSAADERSLMSPPVTRGQTTVAIAVSLALVALFVATMPYARLPTQHTEVILPAYAAAIAMLELTTAALLYGLFAVRRTRALLLLASGYLFSALLVPMWVLSFPGVFDALGLDFGLQVTAMVALLRRLGFPLFVLGYALAPSGTVRGRFAAVAVAKSVLAVTAAVVAALGFILSHREGLPLLMRDARNVAELWRYVPMAAFALYAMGIAALLARRRGPLDIWVCLVLFSLAIELLLISYIGGAIRLSIGWWVGRLYGLAAASIVLLVLLAQTIAVYAGLARTLAAERRVRQNRLIAMEALSASIAHEINQPLASMITKADAARRWLAREEPRLDRAEDALRRIVEDGHRANKVVTGIRTMFLKGAQERVALDLNRLVAEAVATASGEARLEDIPLLTRLPPRLPPVIGNAAQLHRVLCNLIENAIDAIKAAGDHQREVTITTRPGEFGEVRLDIADTGTGVDPELAERIFDPFVSSKSGGMGMGLMFARAVVEAHGGRLWVSTNLPRGAVFHFVLPAAMVPPEWERREP